MLLWWSVVISVVTAAPQHGFTVNKCCSQDQALTPDFTCTSYKNRYSYSMNEIPPWLLSEVTVGSQSLSKFRLTPRFGSQARCEGRQYLIFAYDVDLFTLREDGGLILYDEDYKKNTTFPVSAFCFDSLLLQGSQTVNVILLCPCDTMTCIRKCCPPGRYLDENQRCMPQDMDIAKHTSFHDDSSKYFQLIGFPHCQTVGAYLLNPVTQRSEKYLQYRFLDDGRVEGRGFKQPIPVEEYCWDVTVDENGSETPNLLYCKKWESRGLCSERRVFYGAMLLMDSGFLSTTLIVYAALPELRKGLHAKYLMAHTASFLVAYLFLGIGQLVPDLHYEFCITIAFTIQFTFLAAFLWLNVMCIDIAWAFSGLHSPQGSAVERDHKKFILYSVYAWGTAGILSVITATMEFVPGLAVGSPLKPNFGRRACWFEKPAATLAYFYGPMAFLLLANLMLFLYTAARIISVRRDTAILNRAGNTSGSAIHNDRKRLVLYVKLFCLMGLTWITEIISWAVGGADYYWYITDIVNMLRAVFIFVIFCCKRSVLNLLRARLASFLPCAKRITHGRSGMSMSGPTSSLQLTTSIKKSTRGPSQDT